MAEHDTAYAPTVTREALLALLREWVATCPQTCGQTEELRERTLDALEEAQR